MGVSCEESGRLLNERLGDCWKKLCLKIAAQTVMLKWHSSGAVVLQVLGNPYCVVYVVKILSQYINIIKLRTSWYDRGLDETTVDFMREGFSRFGGLWPYVTYVTVAVSKTANNCFYSLNVFGGSAAVILLGHNIDLKVTLTARNSCFLPCLSSPQ